MQSRDNVLLLMRSPVAALALYEAAPALRDGCNIGPMSSRPGAAKATMYAYLTKEEADAAEKISESGIRVYFNQVVSQGAVEWADVRDRLQFS